MSAEIKLIQHHRPECRTMKSEAYKDADDQKTYNKKKKKERERDGGREYLYLLVTSNEKLFLEDFRSKD